MTLWKFRGLFAPRRLFSKPLGQSVGTCCAQHCFKKWLGGWRGFIPLGSGSLLLSCSFPSPCRLTSFPLLLLSSPLLSEPTLSPSGSVNAAEFHLNPRTWELWAKQEEQSDTPLPHPEQLLNLRNRIISAKVAALFYCQGHGKQTERRSGGGSREAEDREQSTVRQFDAHISNCTDRFSDEFHCQCSDSFRIPPFQLLASVLNLFFQGVHRGLRPYLPNCLHKWQQSSFITLFTISRK